MADADFVLVEEYRPRLGATVHSCPIGGVEDGESHGEAAGRELREETGFETDDLTCLTASHPVSWLRRERAVVLAESLQQVGPDREDDEFLSVRMLPPDEALTAVRSEPVPGWKLTPLLLAREEASDLRAFGTRRAAPDRWYQAGDASRGRESTPDGRERTGSRLRRHSTVGGKYYTRKNYQFI